MGGIWRLKQSWQVEKKLFWLKDDQTETTKNIFIVRFRRQRLFRPQSQREVPAAAPAAAAGMTNKNFNNHFCFQNLKFHHFG